MQGQYRQNQLYSYRTGRVRAYNIRYKYFPVRLASRIENTEECFSQQMIVHIHELEDLIVKISVFIHFYL
jgi:hypothetical protein